jgi:hypothetical protein
VAMTEEHSRLKRGCRASGLQPWPMVYPEKSPTGPRLQYIKITAYCLCNFEFPDYDVIVAICLHLYHPWYTLVVFGKGSRCIKPRDVKTDDLW